MEGSGQFVLNVAPPNDTLELTFEIAAAAPAASAASSPNAAALWRQAARSVLRLGWALFLFWAAAGCCPRDVADARESYWNAEISRFLEAQQTLSGLDSWLDDASADFASGDFVRDGMHLRAQLDHLLVRSVFCTVIFIELDVTVDSGDVIRSYKVYQVDFP